MDTRFPTSDIDEIGPIDGLIAYYNMDNLDGTTLLDNSGNGNNATNSGATLTSGINGNALLFNGSTQYTYVPYTANLTPTLVSVTCWVYATGWASKPNSTFVSKTEGGGYGLRVNETVGNFQFSVYAGGAYRSPLSSSSVADGWHFLAGTFDGRYTKLYIDGVLANTIDAGATYPITYSTNNYLIIGGEANGATGLPPVAFFGGIIDEVRIYNKSLTAAEISQLFKISAKKSTLFTDNYESSLTYNETIELSNKLEGTSPKNLVTGQILGTSSNITQNPGYLEFNGVDSYINIGDTARLNTGGTISCWIYPRSRGENLYGRIIDKGTNESALNGYMIYTNSNTNIALSVNGLSVIASPSFPSLNTWHHLAVVVAADKKEMWIDGIKVANNTNTSLPPDIAGNVYIGNRADNTDRTFDGYIKNLRIYTRTLDAEEIKFLYNKGK